MKQHQGAVHHVNASAGSLGFPGKSGEAVIFSPTVAWKRPRIFPHIRHNDSLRYVIWEGDNGLEAILTKHYKGAL